MLSVNRPMDVVVLNDWVTETKVAPCRSNTSTILAKSESERVRRSTCEGRPALAKRGRRADPQADRLPLCRAHGNGYPALVHALSSLPIHLDGASHAASRALFARVDAPILESDLREADVVLNEVLARLPDDGDVDLVREVAEAFVIERMARAFDIEPERVRRSIELTRALFRNIDGVIRLSDLARMTRLAEELQAEACAIEQEIGCPAPARSAPRAVGDAGDLVQRGVIVFAFAFALANDVLVGLLGYAFARLALNRDLQRDLRADPGGVPAFVRECLRYASFRACIDRSVRGRSRWAAPSSGWVSE